MKLHPNIQRTTLMAASFASLCTLSIGGVASAVAVKTPKITAAVSAADQTKITTIISKGDQEITRRLTTLSTLSSKITAATKLSANDKASLTSEVSSETSGLTALKTKLDADTTLPDALTDAQSIYTDYRVYALVVPKVGLIKTADDQQVTEGKLSDLATKLQTRITAAQTAGKDVTALQAKLSDMQTQTTNAQTISSGIETKVLNLQPSDYNTDHTLLSGDADQLKTAHTDNQAAYADAKSIVNSLASL